MIGEQYAMSANGTPPPEYSSQRSTPEAVSFSEPFKKPTSATSSPDSPTSGGRSQGVEAAVSTSDAEVGLLENEYRTDCGTAGSQCSPPEATRCV